MAWNLCFSCIHIFAISLILIKKTSNDQDYAFCIKSICDYRNNTTISCIFFVSLCLTDPCSMHFNLAGFRQDHECCFWTEQVVFFCSLSWALLKNCVLLVINEKKREEHNEWAMTCDWRFFVRRKRCEDHAINYCDNQRILDVWINTITHVYMGGAGRVKSKEYAFM